VSVYEPGIGPLGPDDTPPRLGRAMWKRFAAAALAIVLLTTAATATAALLEVRDVVSILNTGERIAGIESVLDDVDPGKPQTLLVLGSDRRYSDIKAKIPPRSDTLMLIRLDPEKDATAVLSIPRDLKVEIPYKGGLVTDKINSAYARGGPRLTVRTVKSLLGIPINHVVNVNFGGFRRAVNRLGCVYVDVDRRYFNDNDPPEGGGPNYATINVKQGYQKLCGRDALDYVRYRHFDNDFVRAARQQDFLSQAKHQVGVSRLFSDRKALLKIFSSETQTDLHDTSAILRLLKLVFLSASHPIHEVKFPGEAGLTYVTVDRQKLDQAVFEFLNAKSSKGPRGELKSTAEERRTGRKRKRKPRIGEGLERARVEGENQAISAAPKIPFPVYFPTVRRARAVYVDVPRTYDIYNPAHTKFRAYRMVVQAGIVGEYYGIQGMNWRNPPILEDASEKRRMGGRTYELFFDGSRLRLVAWRTKRAVYWVSNTLLRSLTNAQMLGIARSLTHLGKSG
jgi:polyisoprenyl-teichoic acid--peptidoglycan teichoic acid transferase